MTKGTKWVAGVFCICFVAVIWTFATVLKKIIFNDLDFSEPLVVAYICNGCYVVHLPLYALGRAMGLVSKVPWRRRPASTSRGGGHCQHGGGGGVVAPSWRDDAAAEASDAAAVAAGGPLPEAANGTAGGGSETMQAAAVAGALIAPIWFAAQWMYNVGVAGTSVTSSTVISATSVVWTLLASIVFLGERLTRWKVVGVAACALGNVATLWGGDMHGGQAANLNGDVLCILAAVCYAAYTTILRYLATEDTSVCLLFGTLGLTVLVLGAPVAVLFGGAAWHRMSWEIFGLLLFNGLFDNVLSQFAWAKAVQWTSPTAATVGLSLTIPMSIGADLLSRTELSFWNFLAAVLVILGFITVTLATQSEQLTEPEATPAARSPSLPGSPLATALREDCSNFPGLSGVGRCNGG